MYNASGLLHKHFCDDRFVNSLNITQEQDDMLRAARTKVRSAIREAFVQASRYLPEGVTEEQLDVVSKIKPKFMTQGSYAYRTLNSPCYESQEIDLDDGVYLPMSFINAEPASNMEWFFAIVDGALQELANREGWIFSDKKRTCSRLILPGKQAHIDVPLYAVPDVRHEQMTATLKALNFEKRVSEAVYHENLAISRQVRLEEDEVYLAIRGEGWTKSDPLKIANWFTQEVHVRGYEGGRRLRRICRFLKAWRDYYWESGGPSSITLMACVTASYPADDQGRDDYALQQVVAELPSKLAGEIINPAEPEETLYPRDGMDTVEISSRAEQLASSINTALNQCTGTADVVAHFCQEFGSRMPTNEEWVFPIASAAEIVRSTKPQKVLPRKIPNTRAG